MKHLFIVNPVAGGKKSRPAVTIETIRSFMDGHGGDYDIYITKAPMDACSRIREEADRTADGLRVYACGGDGTLNECVNGAVGKAGVSVTSYPCGTGNDFIRTFGDKDAALFHSLEQLVEGFVRPIDVINCDGRYGVNICSVGFDARVGTDVHKYSGIPVIGGPAGYVVSLGVNLVRGINQHMKMTLPGYTEEKDYALICACNGRFYGGGFNPVTDAMPDDGLMNILAVNAMSALKVPALIGKYAKGRYREMSEYITRYDEDRMELSSPDEFVVNIDGEAVFTDHITFALEHNALSFIFPRDMEFYRPTAD